MSDREFRDIKNKFLKFAPKKYWGDDFDVRFFLIAKLQNIHNKNTLDVGGGIGIISSSLNKSNLRINLDFSFDDLKICKKMDAQIECVCGSMTNMPFKDGKFDYVICSHILEEAKQDDIANNRCHIVHNEIECPSVKLVVSESRRIAKAGNKIFFTTANNASYHANKLNYYELKKYLSSNFTDYSLYYYNTLPRLSKKNKKLNLANTVPKLLLNLMSRGSILQKLLQKDVGKERNSVSFFVEVIKN